jgi:DNA-binding transcriptional LysR family regulator
MRFTLRQLEYFIATCEAGSVTEAALTIPVAQSSVSAAVAQLERALGVQLLIRHHAQGVSMTPAGREFLVRARALLHDVEQLERFADELTEGLSGTLDLGCLVTVAPLVMPQLCSPFLSDHPEARIEMTEAGQSQLVEGLRTGRLSVALTYDLELAPDLEFDPLAELPPYALLSAEHPLAARDSVTLAELAAEPLVLLDLPLSREYFRELFVAAGLEANVVRRSPHLEVIRSLVAHRFGFTILNVLAANDRALDGQGLVSVPIQGPARPMIIGLVTLRAMRQPRLVQAFCEHCRRAVAAGEVPALAGSKRR